MVQYLMVLPRIRLVRVPRIRLVRGEGEER